jgi:hypothetical protein
MQATRRARHFLRPTRAPKQMNAAGATNVGESAHTSLPARLCIHQSFARAAKMLSYVREAVAVDRKIGAKGRRDWRHDSFGTHLRSPHSNR